MKFTESALAQLDKMISENENPNAGIRFYTVPGCCSPRLQMDVVSSPGKEDKLWDLDGLRIYANSDAEEVLAPLTIGFKNGGFYSETNMKENA